MLYSLCGANNGCMEQYTGHYSDMMLGLYLTLVFIEMRPLSGDDSRDICNRLYAVRYPDRPTRLIPVRSLV